MTDNITFERFERDCQANKEARQKSNNPRLIYDFKVLIDGEYRGIMSKDVVGRGYRIYDPDHRPLYKVGESGWHPKHLGSEVEKQADFFQVVRDMLYAGRIPTLDELQATREREAAKAIEDDKIARQAVRDRIAASHGPALLASLKLLLATVDDGHPDHDRLLEAEAENAAAQERLPSFENMKESAFAEARAAIAKAEDIGKHFEDAVEQEKWAMSR